MADRAKMTRPGRSSEPAPVRPCGIRDLRLATAVPHVKLVSFVLLIEPAVRFLEAGSLIEPSCRSILLKHVQRDRSYTATQGKIEQGRTHSLLLRVRMDEELLNESAGHCNEPDGDSALHCHTPPVPFGEPLVLSRRWWIFGVGVVSGH
jgi:hypothetical protein